MSVDDVLASYLETGRLDEAAVAELHADEQAEVREAVIGMRRVRVALAEEDGWADPDPDLEQRVVDGVLGVAADAVSRSAPMSLVEARLRRSRAVAVGASIVAAAAVVVAVVGFTTRPDVASDARTTPAGQDFALVGTGLLPGVTGRVNLRETDSGVRVYLDATGLPRREKGQFYEAWAKTSHGLVSIGTFHTGTDVVLWAGVSIPEIEAISVTLELDDGDPASSGDRVLLVELR